MENYKWSFQLLLEVFCSYTSECPEYPTMSFPIVSNMVFRDEYVEFEFPFHYTFIVDDERISDTGIFTQTDTDAIFNCVNGTFNLSHVDIGSIITRYQLLHS